MRIRSAVIAALIACTAVRPRAAQAQANESSQFDFLIGSWTLDVVPKVGLLVEKIHGAPHLSGTWKASRAMDGMGLEDQLRIVDMAGNPAALVHSLRTFDAKSHRWLIAGVDPYHSSAVASTGDWRNGEMTVSSQATGHDGKTYLSRARFYDITASSFKYALDRSMDNGRTWDEGVTKITAKRVADSASR